jgi:hypothetical protein
MKLARNFLLLTPVLFPLALLAQQPASPDSTSLSQDPQKPNPGGSLFQLGSTPEPAGNLPFPAHANIGSLPLIPPPGASLTPTPDLDALPDFDLTTRKPNAPLPDGPNRTEEAAVQLAQRIRFREIKARALMMPDIQAALESSQKARTDREMRLWLRKHYELLFARMSAMDPSLRPLIQAQQILALAPLVQTIGPEKR